MARTHGLPIPTILVNVERAPASPGLPLDHTDGGDRIGPEYYPNWTISIASMYGSLNTCLTLSKFFLWSQGARL